MSDLVLHEQQTTALAVADPYQPTSFDQAMSLAEIIVRSKLAPNLATKEQAFMVLATGSELGLSAMQSIRSINIIEGKPAVSADLLVALVHKSGKAKCFKEIESTDKKSVWRAQRVDEDEPTVFEFTIEDAKRANLTNKKVWQSYPKQMLSHRARAALARKVFPDVILGVYTTEELEPTATPARFTPTPEVETKPAPVNDVQDAEYEDVPSEPLADPRDLFGAISDLDKLKELANELSAKKIYERGELTKAYAARKTELLAAAGVVPS